MIKKFVLILLFIIIMTSLLLGFPLIAGTIANKIPNQTWDPDGSFWWISIHHIAQALLFIPLIFIVKLIKPTIDFNLRLGDQKKGFQYVQRFTIFFLVYTTIGYVITFATHSFQPFRFDMNATNIFGYLGFQLFLSGPSEELIFRAFAIGLLAFVIPKRLFKGKVSVANIIAAIIFGLAHIGISFAPFSLSFSTFQVFYAIVLGLIYGDCFEKTKSVIYPMMLHSISNVIAVGSTIIVTLLTR